MNDREEFLRQARRQYPVFLASIVTGAPFFPLSLRIGKARLAQTYEERRHQLQALREDALHCGIAVDWKERAHRQFGMHAQPVSAAFRDESAYLRALEKTEEVAHFRRDIALIGARFPEWRPWVTANPLQVVVEAGQWERILATVSWLRENPASGLYVRQLPIPGLDTKFIEARLALLDELLAFPESGVGREGFRRRWGLRDEESLLRIRFLDASWRISCGFPETAEDLALPRSQMASLNLGRADVIMVENLRNFLALPRFPDGVALSGGGDGLMAWKGVPWLQSAGVRYWGDLDAHGFAILSRLRGFLPDVRSFLMTRDVLEAHGDLAVPDETTPPSFDVTRLTTEEAAVWELLRERRIRLEQERIPMSVVDAAMRAAASEVTPRSSP